MKMKAKKKIRALIVRGGKVDPIPVFFNVGPMKSQIGIQSRRFVSLELNVAPIFAQVLLDDGPMTLELILGDKKIRFTR